MSMELDWGADAVFRGVSFEKIGEPALAEVSGRGAEIVKASIRQSVSHSGPSELVESVASSKPYALKGGDGVGMTISPKGKRSKHSTYSTTRRDSSHKSGGTRSRTVSNHDVAFWLEYGVAGRYAGKPWQTRTYRRVEDELTPMIQRKVEQMLGAE